MNNNEFNTQEQENVYQNVMEAKSANRGFAIASLVLGIASIVCCCLSYVGPILAVVAIVFAIVSKSKMGYFDSLAVAGLVMGIIGVVLGIVSIVFGAAFAAYLEEYMAQLEAGSF